MITANLAKSIISKSLFTSALRSVYSSTGPDRNSPHGPLGRQRRPQRELKPYEKLFFSSPLMNINIEMIMAINELRPKATYIIATKNGQFPKQISNSTFNIVECLHYIQGFKYFYKSFPALVDNFTKILVEKIEFSATGIYKVNAMKKLTHMLMNIDCLHGELFSELNSVFFIWSLESSIKANRKLIELITPLKLRLKEMQQKKKSLLESKNKSPDQEETLEALDQQISNIQNEIKKYVYKNRFMKEEDFLCGLHYCLQRGYYSETIVKEFMENILQKDNYGFPEFEHFLQDQEDYFYDKPLSNIYNKKASIYCRMYSNVLYRIKILNELKRMKVHDPKFMDFLKKGRSANQAQESDSTSQESPFLNGQKADISSTSDSTSQQKTQFLTDRLIQESLIPKKQYTHLVTRYLQLLQRKDTLCYILSEQITSQSFRIMQTEFFTYLNEPSAGKHDRHLTLAEVKSRYLNVFKEIFNIEKNGSIYVEAPFSQAAFEVVLRMFDYGDRKEVWELLRIYERYLVGKNMADMKSLAPFYVFEKYGYKSNFVASKLFEYINLKYRLGREETTIKEELIFLGNDICRYLCLYFKLLEQDLGSLFSHYDMGTSLAKPKAATKPGVQDKPTSPQEKQVNFKYQLEFQQAVQMFLHNYHKLISVVYLQRENSGFIGKGMQLSFEYLRVKYLSTKSYEQNLYVQGKIPEEDIRKIIVENNEVIKSHRSYIKNVYEKTFQTASTNPQAKSSSPPPSEQPQKKPPSTDIELNFNRYVQCMFSRRNAVLNPLDQVSIIMDIVETAVELQALKTVDIYEDVLVVFKSIFENKKLVKILTQHQTFPDILKKMIRISQMFKGSYKNESNRLFESILNLTGFNLNSFLHSARINIARDILTAQKTGPIDESFQPYMHTLQLNPRMQQNIRIWPTNTYQINKQNVSSHIRSDILHTALVENGELEKIIRDELAKIKTVKPNEKVRNIKFQLNYLEYPYMANVAINKNNELVVILVRRQTPDSDKPHNAVLNKYYDECENYFRKKGNKVIVASNEYEIRNSLRDLIK